jgi:hypothetical protein
MDSGTQNLSPLLSWTKAFLLLLECLTHEDGIDMLSRSVSKQTQHAPRNIPEERKPQLHCGGSLKTRTDCFLGHNHEEKFSLAALVSKSLSLASFLNKYFM